MLVILIKTEVILSPFHEHGIDVPAHCLGEEWDVLEGTIYEYFEEAGSGVSVPFALPGLLPYPTAENYIQPVPENCGDEGTEYLPADFNEDCYVNLEDIAYFAQLCR